MLREEIVFWTEEEKECNTSNICENFIENVLEYMIRDYISELGMDELYDRSLEKIENMYAFSSRDMYYDCIYEYTV